MLNIAIINDIHNGPDSGTKRGSAALQLLEEFVEFVQQRKPDLVIELGDRVNSMNTEDDTKALTEVASLFQKISVPRVHIMGNHDIDFMSQDDNERILDCSFSSYAETIGGHTFIYWDGDVHMDEDTGVTLIESDIEWLEKAIKEASYPTIVYSHVSLDNGSMRGNFYFEKRYSNHEQYPPQQGERVRDIIERSGKVIACFNGHTHWNAYSCIDGIHYLSLPSLTETFLTHPDPHAAWTWLQVNKESLSVEIFGKTPMKYTLPIREENRHWINADKDYSPVQVDPK